MDISPPEAQKSLLRLCKFLRSKDAHHLVFNQNLDCWINNFERWYLQKTKKLDAFPLPQDTFKKEVWDWATTNQEGITYVADNKLGFKNKEIVFF